LAIKGWRPWLLGLAARKDLDDLGGELAVLLGDPDQGLDDVLLVEFPDRRHRPADHESVGIFELSEQGGIASGGGPLTRSTRLPTASVASARMLHFSCLKQRDQDLERLLVRRCPEDPDRVDQEVGVGLLRDVVGDLRRDARARDVPPVA